MYEDVVVFGYVEMMWSRQAKKTIKEVKLLSGNIRYKPLMVNAFKGQDVKLYVQEFDP